MAKRAIVLGPRAPRRLGEAVERRGSMGERGHGRLNGRIDALAPLGGKGATVGRNGRSGDFKPIMGQVRGDYRGARIEAKPLATFGDGPGGLGDSRGDYRGARIEAKYLAAFGDGPGGLSDSLRPRRKESWGKGE